MITRLSRVGSLAWRFMAVAGISVAAWWSSRLAYADFLHSKQTTELVRKAAALVPNNSDYHSRLAELTYDDDPRGSASELRIALSHNPRDSKAWIELGLRAEFDGRYAEAERHLLEAARVDTQYVPKWTLANYYFRRQQSEEFWLWSRESAAMTISDPAPLFRLCLLMSPDASGLIEKLNITKPEIIARYLELVISENKSDALTSTAGQLLRFARPKDTPLLLTTCDRLLANKEVSRALELWNGLCERHSLPYPAIPASGGTALTNPEWRFSPVSQGFDWRLPQIHGVAVARQDNAEGLRIGFSGRQPEGSEVLSQIVPIRAGRSYIFESVYRTNGIAPQSGLFWQVLDLTTGRPLTIGKDSLSHDTETTATLSFRSLPVTQAVRLSLVYQRAIGTTRIEGAIWLRGTRLTATD